MERGEEGNGGGETGKQRAEEAGNVKKERPLEEGGKGR